VVHDHPSLWKQICAETHEQLQREPMLEHFYVQHVLRHKKFSEALAFLLAQRLSDHALSVESLYEEFRIILSDEDIEKSAVADICAHYDRDPACDGYLTPFLYFKGFHAVQTYRIAHYLWVANRITLALYLQYRSSVEFDVDIHPGAQLGSGLMVDHATGVVIGETAVIGNNVSMLHGVTLGGSGCGKGDRHPKIGNGVLISAGAKVLGNIRVGEGAKIAAGSLVLDDVPAHTTAAGVPAKIVGRPACDQPALEMDQYVEQNKGAGIKLL
jgi:serine O-acetyltransferase